MWNLKTSVIPVVLSATGGMTKTPQEIASKLSSAELRSKQFFNCSQYLERQYQVIQVLI
jgi:hypothetical protein